MELINHTTTSLLPGRGGILPTPAKELHSSTGSYSLLTAMAIAAVWTVKDKAWWMISTRLPLFLTPVLRARHAYSGQTRTVVVNRPGSGSFLPHHTEFYHDAKV